MKHLSKLLSALVIAISISSFAENKAPADAKFLDQFSQHHADAIKMTEMAENKVQDPELKKIVKKMKKDQPKELEQMQSWRQKLYPNAEKSEMKSAKMDMSKLEQASGHEFDMNFAQMMAKHHEQGIEMVNDFSGELSNPQIKKFAQKSAKNQEKEKEKLEKISSSHNM